MNELVFCRNGIKDRKGDKLQLCSYSTSPMIHAAAGAITIYAKNYRRFSAAARQAFRVENDSDTMTEAERYAAEQSPQDQDEERLATNFKYGDEE